MGTGLDGNLDESTQGIVLKYFSFWLLILFRIDSTLC